MHVFTCVICIYQVSTPALSFNHMKLYSYRLFKNPWALETLWHCPSSKIPIYNTLHDEISSRPIDMYSFHETSKTHPPHCLYHTGANMSLIPCAYPN